MCHIDEILLFYIFCVTDDASKMDVHIAKPSAMLCSVKQEL